MGDINRDASGYLNLPDLTAAIERETNAYCASQVGAYARQVGAYSYLSHMTRLSTSRTRLADRSSAGPTPTTPAR
eukprot:6594947-Pyramimonas_sp.AAC.1